MLVQEPVQAAIWHCLNHYNYWNATFLAEKLQAEINNEESLYLLATCYYRSGKANQARCLLQSKGSRSPQCQYLLAKCCLDLNKLSEAEGTLMGGNIFKEKSLDDVAGEFGDAASFALLLLGQVYMQTERKAKAVDALQRAVKLNPFLWHAFELLCRLGEKPDAERLFQLAGLDNFSLCHGTNPIASLVGNHSSAGNASGNAPASGGSVANASLEARPGGGGGGSGGGLGGGLGHGPAAAEPMTIDHVSTPVLQTPNPGDMSSVNTSTPLPCVPLIHHNIPNLTPEDQMMPSMPAFSTMAPSRTKHRNFRLRSVFNAGYTLSPMSPNYSFGVLPLDSSSDASQSSMVFLCPAPPLGEANEPKALPKRLGSRREASGAGHPPAAPSGVGVGGGGRVFCQSGNTATPTLPSPPATNVRRSSRIYSSSNSVKENNKSSARFAMPMKLPLKGRKAKSTKTADTPETVAPGTPDLAELMGIKAEAQQKEVLADAATSTATATMMVASTACSPSLLQQAVVLQKQSAEGLMSLLRTLGRAYASLASYESRQAVETLQALAPHQKRTGWVLSHLAKAHFELADYKQAVKLFEEVREMEPYRTELMEFYSTALWHLQEEVALSALAQELLDQDKMSAATWCCAGNCLDLQKDREAALKFFQRAIQVDPKFAYAYTLLGHQYLALEETDKAMDCFKNAVRVDPIHYNGWYGMGMIYYKQERYPLAEFYFKRALSINGHSPVLKCHVAIVEHAMGRTDRALHGLNSALEAEPLNPLCKFHRASIYFACDRLDDALRELEQLKQIAPREALVYYLMGNVYKKRNETHLALTHFSWANDLDPKGASGARRHIKEVIDPTTSLSLLPASAQASALEDPPTGQPDVAGDVSGHDSAASTPAVTRATPGGGASAGAADASVESLEMPPLPAMASMDSDDGEPY